MLLAQKCETERLGALVTYKLFSSKALCLGCLLISTVSEFALAADAADTAATVVGHDWTGAFVGAQGGYARGDSTTGSYFRDSGLIEGAASYNSNGAFSGIYVGYNRQFVSRFVLGLEVDANISGLSGASTDVVNAAGEFLPGNVVKSSLDWFGSARVRGGYAIGRFLPFITGGVAFGHYSATPDYLNTPPIPGDSIHVGWTAGAGLEYALTNRLTARAEYRFTDYGTNSYEIPSFPEEETKAYLRTSDIRFGVSYKFLAPDPTGIIEASANSAPHSWTGLFIGVHGGVGVSKIGWIYQNSGSDAGHLGNGFLGGVQAGYNAQFGNWVLGAEGDVAASGIAGTVPCPSPAFSCKSQIKWLGSLRLRVGYSAGDWLVYGTGGLGIGSVNIETTLDPVPGTFGTRLTRYGWAAGAGAEVALNDHWSLKGEFMHYDLGKSTHEVDFGLLVDVDTAVNTGKIGLNYKF